MRRVIRGDFGGESRIDLKLVLLLLCRAGREILFAQRTVAMARPQMGCGPAFATGGSSHSPSSPTCRLLRFAGRLGDLVAGLDLGDDIPQADEDVRLAVRSGSKQDAYPTLVRVAEANDLLCLLGLDDGPGLFLAPMPAPRLDFGVRAALALTLARAILCCQPGSAGGGWALRHSSHFLQCRQWTL